MIAALLQLETYLSSLKDRVLSRQVADVREVIDAMRRQLDSYSPAPVKSKKKPPKAKAKAKGKAKKKKAPSPRKKKPSAAPSPKAKKKGRKPKQKAGKQELDDDEDEDAEALEEKKKSPSAGTTARRSFVVAYCEGAVERGAAVVAMFGRNQHGHINSIRLRCPQGRLTRHPPAGEVTRRRAPSPAGG